MTARALAAVCKRHGIRLATTPMGDGETYAWTASVQDGDVSAIANEMTEADAVAALLKARYQIRTNRNTGRVPSGKEWSATCPCDAVFEGHNYGPTELAAVVALADRLAGVQG